MSELFTGRLGERHDAVAPDGSEIRLLAATGRASMVHCTLPTGQASLAVAHKTVEEIWFILSGQGQVWRRQGDEELVVNVRPGSCLTIPTGVHFQFRTIGDEPLRVVIATIPPWPGADEAYRVDDHWPVRPAR